MNKIWNLPITKLMSFFEIEELRPVLLVTSAPAWKVVKSYLNLPVMVRLEPVEATISHWESLLMDCQISSEMVVYAVGGGLTADTAKYIGARFSLPVVCLPTALTVDAFFTWASGIRKDGCVVYIESKVPEELVVDWRVIAAAPEHLRAAGITDVLSIATGLWDWKLAHERGQNPPGMEWQPWVEHAAHSILNAVLECAEAAGKGDEAGMKQLLDCLMLEVQLCNQVGHARPEEGSEHYFAYCAENYTGHGLPHGDLVGPGILTMARRQGQDVEPLERALRACHVPLERIPAKIVEQVLVELPAYVRKHHLPYGIACEASYKGHEV
jgi:glycerol-1-phosphate dehydrogenase [NAD(P)+]